MRTGAILPVVGVTFYQDVVSATHTGDQVILEHQPDNEYDTNAVVVRNAADKTLGHLPANLAPRFTNPNFGGTPGARWTATVTELTHYENTVGLRIKLGTQLPSHTPKPAH